VMTSNQGQEPALFHQRARQLWMKKRNEEGMGATEITAYAAHRSRGSDLVAVFQNGLVRRDGCS
jgi:hypothetical protein